MTWQCMQRGEKKGDINEKTKEIQKQEEESTNNPWPTQKKNTKDSEVTKQQAKKKMREEKLVAPFILHEIEDNG